MIDPGAIPQIPGDMAVLGQHATAVTGVGTAFADTGRRVHATWQGLTPFYTAPESGQLLAATGPVQSASASVGQDIGSVGTALGTYATEVAAIKTRLDALRAQAADFVAMTRVTEDWRDDEGEVDRHNQLLGDVNAAVADFMDAQRRCANSILALYTDARYTAENGDGTVTEYEFGYTREMLDGALAHEEGLPWGSAEEHDRGILGDVGAFFGGVGTGAVDMVVGLGALIGYAEGEWSWANAGAAWKGLGIFVVALSPIHSTINAHMDLPGLPKGTLHNTLIGAGKAIIAYDTWGEDKSKAAGMATFNIVSAIIGTKGAGAGLRGGGAAVQSSRFGAVAQVGAGAVKAGEFIGRLPSVGDVALGAIRKFPGFQIPHVQLPDVDLPPTHIDTPTIDVPRADTPTVPDRPSVGDAVGDRPLPPAAVITPDGVVDGRVFDPPAAQATPDGPVIRDGVIGGRTTEAAPTFPDPDRTPAPALVGAAEPPLVRDGVIGGRTPVEAPTVPGPNRAEVPAMVGAAEPPLVRDGVIGGRGGDGPASHTPDTSGRSGGDAPPFRGYLDTLATPRSQAAAPPLRAAEPDQTLFRGGPGDSSNTPPAQREPDAATRPEADTPQEHGDPPDGRPSEREGRGGDAREGNTPDGPGNTPNQDSPADRSRIFDESTLAPVAPGMTRELGVLPEARIGRDPSGLIDTVDGRPVGEFLNDVGMRRAEDFRAGRAGGQFSRNDIGNVSAVAIDRRTGEIFEGTNGTDKSVIPDGQLHPLLRHRLVEMGSGPGYAVIDRNGNVGPELRQYPHPAKPLQHAEVKAVNELLWRRGPDVDETVFQELRVDNFQPFLQRGLEQIPCCANCTRLLDGTPSNARKNTGYPAQFFPQLPE